LTPIQILMVSLVVMAGSALQGSVGFGLGMLAAPVLVLIDPKLIPGPLLCAALFLTILVAFREHRAIELRGIGWALAGRLPGTALGAAAVALAPQRATTLLVGLMVLLAVFLIGAGIRPERSRAVLLGAGTLSGFMGTTTSIGGPAVAVLYHDAEGPRLRGTLSSFFVVGLVVSLSALAFVGRFGQEEMRSSLFLLPGVMLGYLFSGRIAPILDRGYTRPALLTVSALAGLSVIVRTMLGSS
jgi:uncharacterized membrane protein YfcA